MIKFQKREKVAGVNLLKFLERPFTTVDPNMHSNEI